MDKELESMHAKDEIDTLRKKCNEGKYCNNNQRMGFIEMEEGNRTEICTKYIQKPQESCRRRKLDR